MIASGYYETKRDDINSANNLYTYVQSYLVNP